MSKITKRQLQESHNKLLNQFASLVRELKVNNVIDDSVCPAFIKKTEPQLKQLDQSVFDGLDEKWRWAATDRNGKAFLFSRKPTASNIEWYAQSVFDYEKIGDNYDTSNWQNSLIERDIAKEQLEVDLSSELTGSELCKAMLARGDKYVLCIVSPYRDAIDNDSIVLPKIVTTFHEYGFITTNGKWAYAIPINNQGEPLTAAEAGL